MKIVLVTPSVQRALPRFGLDYSMIADEIESLKRLSPFDKEEFNLAQSAFIKLSDKGFNVPKNFEVDYSIFTIVNGRTVMVTLDDNDMIELKTNESRDSLHKLRLSLYNYLILHFKESVQSEHYEVSQLSI